MIHSNCPPPRQIFSCYMIIIVKFKLVKITILVKENHHSIPIWVVSMLVNVSLFTFCVSEEENITVS